MNGPRINFIASRLMVGLCLIALLAVITGYFQVPQPDEGSAAHIFQLSIALLLPTILLFLVTLDWIRPLRSMMPLLFSSASLIAGFAALYYLEHYYYLAQH